MLNIDNLFQDSLKLLRNTRTINLTSELYAEEKAALINMNGYFADRSEKRKDALKQFNANYCRYFVTCAAAAHLKGNEKAKELYLSIAKQLNETIV